MAAYPHTLNTPHEVYPEPINGHQTTLAEDGTPRGRLMHAETVYSFRVIHRALSATDKNTVQSFYDTNKALAFTYTWRGDNTTFDCIFTNPPTVVRIPSHSAIGARFDVVCTFMGRRQ